MEHQDMVTCQALKRLGFPQDDAEFAWALYRGKPIREFGFPLLQDGEYQWIAVDRNYSSSWCACPSPLEALEWLEQERDITFERHYDPRTQYAAEWWAIWYEDSMSLIGVGGGTLPAGRLIAETAQELVRFICAGLERDAAAEQVKESGRNVSAE